MGRTASLRIAARRCCRVETGRKPSGGERQRHSGGNEAFRGGKLFLFVQNFPKKLSQNCHDCPVMWYYINREGNEHGKGFDRGR